MLTDLLFFLFTGATLSLLIWTGMELFRNQEDPLGDRLEGLQSQAMVVAARAARRPRSTATRRQTGRVHHQDVRQAPRACVKHRSAGGVPLHQASWAAVDRLDGCR